MYSIESLSHVMLRASEKAATPEEDHPCHQGDPEYFSSGDKIGGLAMKNELNVVREENRRETAGAIRQGK